MNAGNSFNGVMRRSDVTPSSNPSWEKAVGHATPFTAQHRINPASDNAWRRGHPPHQVRRHQHLTLENLEAILLATSKSLRFNANRRAS